MACWDSGAIPDSDELYSSLNYYSDFLNLKHLLATNDCPTDSEITAIRAIFGECQTRMDALNDRIDILKATMDRLVAERDDMAERVQLYKNILAPVRRMPSELVCEIFGWTLPRTTAFTEDTLEQPPVPQLSWYLGHVSRSWRNISLAYPLLWSTITVFHSYRHPQATSRLPIIQTQLLRSANAPLTVDFRWWEDKIPEATSLLSALLTHSNRWESLRFGCDEDTGPVLLRLLQRVKGRLPQLKKLEFADKGADPDSVGLDVFLIAPRLHDVYLSDLTFNYRSPSLLLPWGQITRYGGALDLEQQLNILQTSSNLVECALGIEDWDVVLRNVNPTLHKLRRLYIPQGEVLDYIVAAPLLEYFSCDSRLASVLPFLQRSSCQLTTLVLAKECDPDGLIPILQTTPSLRSLVLGYVHKDDHSILKSMTVSGSGADLCPNLNFLAYGCMDPWVPLESDLFIPMIQSRLQPGHRSRLSSLRLFSCVSNRDFSVIMHRMQPLIDQGLDISLGQGLQHETRFIADAQRLFVLPC